MSLAALSRILLLPVEGSGRRTWIRITTCLAAFPLLVLASFYMLVCLTRIDLGRWPVFNDPFPKTGLPENFPRLCIGLSLITFPFVSLAAAVSALLGRWRFRDFPVWKALVLTAASAALLLVICEMDPGGFFNWFWD